MVPPRNIAPISSRRQGQAVPREVRGEDPVGDRLAVDEHPVAVEEDGGGSHAGPFRIVMIVSP